MSSWHSQRDSPSEGLRYRAPARRGGAALRAPGRIPFVDLVAQHAAIRRKLIGAASTVLRDADFVMGHAVELFEKEFARFCDARHGVGVDSGTSALELALRAYGIGVGDEVITAANTFVATALAISHTGATPVLLDVDPTTHTMDVARLEGAITRRTRAIVPVHLYGHPADMDPILEIAERRRLVVIEDACQAHGARYRGRRVGSLGHAAAFSFYPSKNLGGCGDGGMVVTNDADIARLVRLLRNYGQGEKYHHLVQGYNRRLDTIQAAVLRVKLKHLDEWNDARRKHAERYARLLDGSHVLIPREARHADPVWHLYVIRARDRDALKARLRGQGIDTGVHYPIPIHLQSAYRGLGHRPGDFPVTEQAANSILSLPMYAELSAQAIEKVAAAVRALATPWNDPVEIR